MVLLEKLKNLHKEGNEITFEVSSHKRIPNVCLLNGAILGNIHLNTIKAFKKYCNR